MFGLIFTILAIFISVLGWLANRARKRRMRNALGREIKENEMTSISSWIAVSEAEDQQKRRQI